VRTNVTGAENVVSAALANDVPTTIALSTDKAVNPVNLYGATKLAAEKLITQANAYAGDASVRFANVRYGNVVGSRGSVIPLFLEQRSKGTITVTDERMSRFWITLEEGVRLVVRCVEEMQGGEIFVPKIPSMKLIDLVKAVAPGCRTEIVGIRAGEKLHEVLISEDEARQTLELDDYYVVQPMHPWWVPGRWAHVRRVPDGFRFTSDTNARWLQADDLARLVECG
jgi:UDP-N-acetylglucosamine 4,6-dehydratase